MEDLIYRELTHILKNGVQRKEPLSRHTTFCIGGPADYFVTPASSEELKKTLLLCKKEKIPYTILGNGSNLLVSDQGVRGVVIHMQHEAIPGIKTSVSDTVYKKKDDMYFLTAQAGQMLAKTAVQAARWGLCGLEFAAGIPGSLGGAVVMNAGAYGSEIQDFLVSVEVMDEEGQECSLKKEDLKYGYRTSLLQNQKYIVLKAVFALRQGDPEQIQSTIRKFNVARREKQPLEFPSAGSAFKRPEGNYAGKLIMEAGLRGTQIGGAQISEKHCGFIINTGSATAEDVICLMRKVREKVKEQTGILLEPEVKLIGEFPEELQL